MPTKEGLPPRSNSARQMEKVNIKNIGWFYQLTWYECISCRFSFTDPREDYPKDAGIDWVKKIYVIPDDCEIVRKQDSQNVWSRFFGK